MMSGKIQIGYMSDLHIERDAHASISMSPAVERLDRLRAEEIGYPQVGPELTSILDVDLVILAGDIGVGSSGIAYADTVSRYLNVPVVVIMGNHEGYGGRDLDLLLPELHHAAAATRNGRATILDSEGTVHRPGVYFLENEAEVFQIRGRRLHVLGCCLWTDFAITGDAISGMANVTTGLNDYVYIRSGGRRLRGPDTLAWHRASRAWLGREIEAVHATAPEDLVLVMTHHAPIAEGAAPCFVGGKLSPGFASDMRAEIELWQPDGWIFGHTHFTTQTMVAGVPVVAAQRGYLGVEPGSEAFQPAVLEL